MSAVAIVLVGTDCNLALEQHQAQDYTSNIFQSVVLLVVDVDVAHDRCAQQKWSYSDGERHRLEFLLTTVQ